jgi:hypothetical protein
LPQPSAEIVCPPELCESQGLGDIFEMKVILLALHDTTSLRLQDFFAEP